MRQFNWKIGSKRHLLSAISAVGIVMLSGFGEQGARQATSGAKWVANDLCFVGAPSMAVVATDGAIGDRGLLSRLYPAGLDRLHRDDKTARFFRAALPGNLDEMASVDERKTTFVSVVLPMIHHVNQEILYHRRLVEADVRCRSDGRPIGIALQAEILRLHERYRTDGNFAALQSRLDIVPPSLAIAQAAIESGWGTSRFALSGNALFGQRTTNPDRGMHPANLPTATPVRVAAFDHLMASVRSYVHNLNTYPAYRDFRDRRAAFRRNGEEPEGLALAGTLIAYSSRGEAYVRDLKSIIRSNRLAIFDTATGAMASGGRPSGSDT